MTGKGGSPKCLPGCVCGKHVKPRVIDWNDPEARKAYNRQKAAERYAADPEPAKDAARRWRDAHPGDRATRKQLLGSMAAGDLKWLYGVTPERLRELFTAQEGRCYLCGEPLNLDKPRAVSIDHDHACCRGKRSCGSCVRGLACHKCNVGTALFGDDPERMRRVADNLEMANRQIRESRPVKGTDKSGSNAPLGKG